MWYGIYVCGTASLVVQLVESACNIGHLDSILHLRRSPGKGYPLQYSVLENTMDCIVYEVAKSRPQLSDFHFHLESGGLAAVSQLCPLGQPRKEGL